MLNFLFRHVGLWIVLIIAMFLLAAGSAVLEAWLDFRKRPTEPMFWCNKHGFFRMQHTLPLFPEMGGTADNSYVCPTCYKTAVFDNPNMKR
jgi:hypothetical protein